MVSWLKRNRLTGRRKRKCALTSSDLLMEGLVHLSFDSLNVASNP